MASVSVTRKGSEMAKAKKKKESVTLEFELPNDKGKEYILYHLDGLYSTAGYSRDEVVITHTELANFTVTDTGNGYEITDKSAYGGTKKYSIDYGGMADLYAALRIFYHNAGKVHGEYWTVIEGKKI
jgi:hypothetical protein